jgi:hypothetical protein
MLLTTSSANIPQPAGIRITPARPYAWSAAWNSLEGHRWFDLVRWGNVVETMNNYYSSETQFHSYYQGANLTEDEVYLPVPVDQVDNAGDLYN